MQRALTTKRFTGAGRPDELSFTIRDRLQWATVSGARALAWTIASALWRPARQATSSSWGQATGG